MGRGGNVELGTSGQVKWRVQMRHASPAAAVQASPDHARVDLRLVWAGDGYRQDPHDVVSSPKLATWLSKDG
jgi:hypothetical protein